MTYSKYLVIVKLCAYIKALDYLHVCLVIIYLTGFNRPMIHFIHIHPNAKANGLPCIDTLLYVRIRIMFTIQIIAMIT